MKMKTRKLNAKDKGAVVTVVCVRGEKVGERITGIYEGQVAGRRPGCVRIQNVGIIWTSNWEVLESEV